MATLFPLRDEIVGGRRPTNLPLAPERMLQLYYRMSLTRYLNDRLLSLKDDRKIQGAVHRSTGQEAVGIGVGAALRDDDYILSHFRGYAHWIGKGLDLDPLVAEIFGKAAGICGGKAGEMLITDMKKSTISTTIVGAGLPLAAGLGLSFRLRGSDQVAVCYFGEGATNEGAFHEALNFSSLHRLPVLFVCENNQWAMATGMERSLPVHDIAIRALSYGIEGMTADGNDVLEMFELTQKLVGRLRNGEGPFLVEAKTYRLGSFSSNDRKSGYQPQQEICRWMAKDPIPRFRHQLRLLEITVDEHLDEADSVARREVDQAISRAMDAPYPAADALYENVYVAEGRKSTRSVEINGKPNTLSTEASR